MFKIKATLTRSKTRTSAVTTSIQHYNGSPCLCNMAGKTNRRYEDWKERSEIVFTDSTIVCIENPKGCTISNKQVCHDHSISGECGKINCIFTYYQYILLKSNLQMKPQTLSLKIGSKSINYLGTNLIRMCIKLLSYGSLLD